MSSTPNQQEMIALADLAMVNVVAAGHVYPDPTYVRALRFQQTARAPLVFAVRADRLTDQLSLDDVVALAGADDVREACDRLTTDTGDIHQPVFVAQDGDVYRVVERCPRTPDRLAAAELVARLTGSAGPGMSTDELMALTRGED